MHPYTVKAWLVALAIALVPCIANAVGLGRLSMLSALGDRLDVEIELVSVTKEELSTISARLSGPDAYRQANLQYNAALVGARVAVERRPGGQPFIKITSSRTVNEPFIDVLVELTSSSGRLVREYTVLVDPPGTVAPPATTAAPAARPAPAPTPPVAESAPSTRRQGAAPRPTAAPAPMAGAKEYGPIKQGENLSSIARSVAPEGVTLEQMMVGLYRSNPDAFIGKNLNMVKAGRILRVPEKDEVAAVPAADAKREFRAQVADWTSYRQNLAGSPGTARAEGRSASAGRITTKVEDKAGSEPRDVVKLSRGEPAGTDAAKGKARGTAERVRALEEEVLARDKALAEANDRISKLEKTIKDMQKLAELKSPGMADAQQKAEQAAKAKAEAQPAPKPEAKAEAPAPKPEAKAEAPAPKPEAKAEAPKPEPTPAPKPDTVATAKPEAEKDPAKVEADKAASAPAPDAAKAEAPKPEAKAEPAPKPKVVAPPPPPPPPSMMDQIIEAAADPLYLGAGGGLLVLGGLGFWLARRRRGAEAAEAEPRKAAPVLARTPAPAPAPAGPDTTMTMPAAAIAAATAVPAAAAAVDEVDPLAEAEVYIAYGRDAQAEEILKEALAKNPKREDAQLKLLEIYSARKDKSAFNKVATEFNKQTGGTGENWLAAAAMGYALDPDNALYEAGRHAAAAAPAAAAGGDLDFDLGGDTAVGSATDITLDSGTAAHQIIAHDSTAVLDAAELRSMAAEAQKEAESTAAPMMPDFSLDIPSAGGQDAAVTQTDIALEAVPTKDDHILDFQIELPKDEAPETIAPTPSEAPATDAGLDFKLDIPDLDLGEKPEAPETMGGGGEKDGHWYDVQTKFDLAKAYQEMGDKDGAREILQEVIKEGDIEQQSQAQQLLDSLA